MRTMRPRAGCQTRTVRSSPAEAQAKGGGSIASAWRGRRAKAWTGAVWLVSVRRRRPEAASQTLMERWALAVMAVLASGEQAIERVERVEPWRRAVRSRLAG